MAAAYETPCFLYSLIAGADLSAKQFFAVTVDSSGNAVVAGVGTVIAGVLQNKPVSGGECQIMQLGITKMVAGGALATAGVNVGVDASGQVKAVTLGAGSGTSVIGILLSTAGAAGDLVAVLLSPSGAIPTTPA